MMKSTCYYPALGLLAGVTVLAAPAWGNQQERSDRQDAQAEAQVRDSSSSENPSHTGEFVKLGDGQFVMSADGNRHTHKITDETKVTINGKNANLEDLEEGDQIKVTTGEDNVALSITAMRRQTRAQQPLQSPGQTGPTGAPREKMRQADQRGGVELGVMIGPSRTTGVYVERVRPGSAAEQAGIRERDYILSINDTNIASMEDFDTVMAEVQPSSQGTIVVWRNEEKQELNVTFQEGRVASFRADSEDRQPPVSDQSGSAWLGVALDETEGENKGVRVAGVYPSGPAARAGVYAGDLVTQVGGTTVSSPEEIVTQIDAMSPSDQVELTVLRQDEERTVTAVLGDRSEFMGNIEAYPSSPPQTQPQTQTRGFRGDFDPQETMPEHSMMLEQHRRFAEQHQRIEERLEDVLDELQALRQEVQELKQDSN